MLNVIIKAQMVRLALLIFYKCVQHLKPIEHWKKTWRPVEIIKTNANTFERKSREK